MRSIVPLTVSFPSSFSIQLTVRERLGHIGSKDYGLGQVFCTGHCSISSVANGYAFQTLSQQGILVACDSLVLRFHTSASCFSTQTRERIRLVSIIGGGWETSRNSSV